MDRVTISRDVLSGAILLALSVSYYLGTRTLPAGEAEPGPAFFPKLLAGALFLLAGSILVSGLRSREREPRPEPLARPLLVVVLTIGYAMSYARLGFVPSTLAYSLGLALVFGQHQLRYLVPISAGTTGFLYVALGWGLGIPL